MNRLIKNKIGIILEKIGVSIFLLLFWLPKGFYLGGDGYFLGNYNESLEIIFPYAGLGILFVFFGKYLSKTQIQVSQKQILFFLFFLATFGIASLFSSCPEVSIMFLIVWAIALFSASFGSTFLIEKKTEGILFFLGILFGFIYSKYNPTLNISLDLLAIASLILSTFLILNKPFKGKLLMILILFWIIFSSDNLGLLVLTIMLWFFSRIWLPRARKKDEKHLILFPLFFLICLVFYGFYQKIFDFSTSKIIIPIFENWLNLILGFGEGQFLNTLQNFSSTYLIPQKMVFPNWGIVLSFFEKGILGIIMILILSFNSLLFQKKSVFLPTFLFFSFWLFSVDYLSTENGILLALVFLFTQKEPFKKNQ